MKTTNITSVYDLLNDNSYHIEFNGHLTNHVKHAVVALAGIGAPEETIREYYNNYCRMTPYGYPLEAPREPKHNITDSNWKDFISSRTSYQSYCEFFERQLTRIGRDETVAKFSPELLEGWIGAFTHATIHLGWGLKSGNDWMVVEGLAYSAYTSVRCLPAEDIEDEWLTADTVMDGAKQMLKIWENDEFRARTVNVSAQAMSDAEFHPELLRSGLQARIASMCAARIPELIKKPRWVSECAVPEAWRDLRRLVSLLYLARPGDFVVLHLATSLYALETIAALLNETQNRRLLHLFWAGTWTILFAEGKAPELSKFMALHDIFDGLNDLDTDFQWDITCRRAFLEEEEHNPKLVYVLLNWWKEDPLTLYRHAAEQFTSTPDLPPSFDQVPQQD